jgi:hypothetical protein
MQRRTLVVDELDQPQSASTLTVPNLHAIDAEAAVPLRANSFTSVPPSTLKKTGSLDKYSTEEMAA